ncbi:hypothetical protein M514_26813 [Trichuris suis]|uniref:Reverse transcriptase zinc-binding domain-containing protein n=1 Tax=Trichuris suis TaxID=68888 RepID=A0A085MUW0_9BILA|nr:hypothetical protein M514_26813 [Trichuris suis]
MLRTYLVPRLLYNFTVSNPLASTAYTIDRLIRQAVKTILHLPLSTMSDDYFYLPCTQGGLGFACLAEKSDLCVLNLIRKMELSTDEISRKMVELLPAQRMHSKLMRKYEMVSLNLCDIRAVKLSLMQGRRERFAATYQGNGFVQFRKRCSNEWISGERVTGRNDILSIKTRTNLVPTRLQTHRGRTEPGDQRILCRRCGTVSGAQESLTHISQNCSFTHGLICRRHNMVAAKLTSLLEAHGYDCFTEPTCGTKMLHTSQTYLPQKMAEVGLSISQFHTRRMTHLLEDTRKSAANMPIWHRL